jgi:sugar (pentulose or hexulose) kinase
LSEIRIMGSGSSNAFWLQILADILGVRVGRAAGDALDGAARIASAPTAAAAARDVSPLVWFEPHEAAAYAARYERWRRQHPCAAPPPGRGRKSAKT